MKKILWFLISISLLSTYLLTSYRPYIEKRIVIPHSVSDPEESDNKKIDAIPQNVSAKEIRPILPKGIYDLNAGPRFSNYRLSPEPKKDLEIIKYLIISYQLSVKNNSSNIPTGSNREITRQLMGENPSEIVFIPKDDPSIKNGEIIDRWGNPLFFHVVSSKSCDIFSAGPDGIRGTFDDLVEKGPEKIDYSSDQN